MKTPLSHEILDNWQLPEAPKHRLTVSTLLRAEQAAGRRVGLLLDLSNHGE
jgi:alpha-glucan,water dikinase